MQMNHYNQGQRQSPPRHGDDFPQFRGPDLPVIKSIIMDNNLEAMNKYASELGALFTKKHNDTNKPLSSSQIRTILDELQRMDNNQIQNINLLRPRIAYAAGRHGGRVKELQMVLEEAIKFVLQGNTPEHFIRFKYFVEAIVAYHRFHGGKE
jgi:CRISPR-associated protein Csm2